jgi:hypothetical protein
MLLRLSSGDVFQLHETIACILEPARYPSAVEWSADVMSCVIRLVDAEKALFSLPTVTSPNIAWCGERTGEAVADYLAYYWQVDTALARRKQLGLAKLGVRSRAAFRQLLQ